MTGEIHSIVVKAGIQALRLLPENKRNELLNGLARPEECMNWVFKYPTFRTKEEEQAMDIIQRAGKIIEEKLKINPFNPVPSNCPKQDPEL